MSLQEHGLLGESPALVALEETVRRLLPASMAPRPAPILILGETGPGKGVLARALHDESAR